jgi:hypothetical protein
LKSPRERKPLNTEEDKGFKTDRPLSRGSSDLEEISPVRAIKSLEAKKVELNKKLVNEIIFTKVLKTWNVRDNQERRPSLVLPQNDLKAVENFKSLQNVFKNSSLIEYENIYKRLQSESKEIAKIFDFKNESKKIIESQKNLWGQEKFLFESYREVCNEIDHKKKLEKQMLLNNFSNNKRLMMQQQTLDDLARAYEQMETQYIDKQRQIKMNIEKKGKKAVAPVIATTKVNISNPVVLTTTVEEFTKYLVILNNNFSFF